MHSMILKMDGSLYVFGNNDCGQLGFKSIKNFIIVPTLLMINPNISLIACGNKHSVILYDDGSVFVFGCNSKGQIGLDKYRNYLEPTFLIKDPNIIQINNSRKKIWSPINHKYFSNKFRNSVLCFYLILKYIYNLTSIKIPKFVIYEIILHMS